MPPLLVLGTHNKKKLAELQQLLSPHGFELRTLADYSHALNVDETGNTFTENARLKACVQARHLKQWVLAEDSGLSVDALDGEPGVNSALYAGTHGDDEANNNLLLARLAETPLAERTAHYTCHAVLADPSGQIRAEVEEYCHGRIRTERHGSGGFGYDPLFEVVEFGQTFGELSPEIKARISHRARAMQAMLPRILELSLGGAWAKS
jgi:XTP/dITP diphosphohydrolase